MTSERFFRLAFRTTAFAEALTWVGMLTALAIKYPLGGSPIYVTVFGWMHGIVWIAFVIACFAAALRFRWHWFTALFGLGISVLPFLTVPFDLWVERTGRLEAKEPARAGAAQASL